MLVKVGFFYRNYPELNIQRRRNAALERVDHRELRLQLPKKLRIIIVIGARRSQILNFLSIDRSSNYYSAASYQCLCGQLAISDGHCFKLCEPHHVPAPNLKAAAATFHLIFSFYDSTTFHHQLLLLILLHQLPSRF